MCTRRDKNLGVKSLLGFLFKEVIIISSLILTTILASSVDCVNPIAITQQFILQGMVKKPKHIWFFILATGITNLISGLLVYYGLAAIMGRLAKSLMENYSTIIYGLELALGIAFLIATFHLVFKIFKNKSSGIQISSNDEEKLSKKIKSVSPFSLTILGITATLYELTSALPYFAFLAILLTFKLSLATLMLILILYNAIYISPQAAMYFLYIKKQHKFDKLYIFIKEKMKKYSSVLAPTALFLIGGFLVFHSALKFK